MRCVHFPVVVLTSNGERAFPPAFLRRCLQLNMDWPQERERKQKKLARVVAKHLAFAPKQRERVNQLISVFVDRLETNSTELATDQLLNALYLVLKDVDPERGIADPDALLETLWRPLSE